MKRESRQKEIGRVRPPRVQITYDVNKDGATEKRDIPFIVGVMSDLAGKALLPPLKDRKFVAVDRDNIDTVMAGISPKLIFKVDNRLTADDAMLPVELRFKSMSDFSPAAVAKQIKPLKELLALRSNLNNLRSSLIGNDKGDALLQDVLSNPEALLRIAAETGGKTAREE